jgi:hypothetical protein
MSPVLVPMTRHEFKEQKDIAHRKQVQAGISRISAGLGIAGLGVVGASAVARKKPKLLRIQPHRAEEVAHKLSQRGIYTTVGSTGVGSASSLYFAGTQKKEARMSNEQLNRQKLSSLAKAYKTVTPPSPAAWKQAGDPLDQRWRDEVSMGSQRAHDYALEPSRRKEQEHRHKAAIGRNVALGSSLGGVGTLGAAAIKRRYGLLLPATALAGGSFAARQYGKHQERQAERWGESARKIRARGFQRLEDKGKVQKAGGSVAGRVVNRGGRLFFQRGFAVPNRFGFRRPRV